MLQGCRKRGWEKKGTHYACIKFFKVKILQPSCTCIGVQYLPFHQKAALVCGTCGRSPVEADGWWGPLCGWSQPTCSGESGVQRRQWHQDLKNKHNYFKLVFTTIKSPSVCACRVILFLKFLLIFTAWTTGNWSHIYWAVNWQPFKDCIIPETRTLAETYMPC